MKSSRTLPRLMLVCLFAIVGAGGGICWQALRITGKPQEFRSRARLVSDLTAEMRDGYKGNGEHDNSDMYGTILETLESDFMSRRALERVRALHPKLPESAVQIRAQQSPGTTIFNVLATGSEPRYTKIFLDALIDEFIAFQQSFREKSAAKVWQHFLQTVLDRQKRMEESFVVLEKARSKAETPSAKAEHQRLVARLVKLRDHRDDLRLQLKPLPVNNPGRPALEDQLPAVEGDIQQVESAIKLHETAVTEWRMAEEAYAQAKKTYDNIFQAVQSLQTVDRQLFQITILERASAAAEHVEDWRVPLATGALGGALFGAVLGFLLSLLILRPLPVSGVPPLP